jgi:hypothetical protein
MKVCIAVLCLALALPAFAQVSPPAPKPVAKDAKTDCATAKKPRKPSRENAKG